MDDKNPAVCVVCGEPATKSNSFKMNYGADGAEVSVTVPCCDGMMCQKLAQQRAEVDTLILYTRAFKAKGGEFSRKINLADE